jgi:hypothetical protein
MTKSSNDSENDSIAAATMPGNASGSVTRTNAVNSVAYRSIAAFSRFGSMLATLALTVTTTKLRQNMMCAIKIVQKPSSISCRPLTNNASSDEPMTTSGVAIGRKISRFVAERP